MNKNKTNLSVINNAGIRINPNIIVGESGSHSSGDILDANATEELIQNAIPQDNVSDKIHELQTSVENIQSLIDADNDDIDHAIDKFEEIVQFLDNIEPGSELYTIITSHIDNGSTKVVKHIEVLTQDEYDAL